MAVKYDDIKLTPSDALNVYVEKYPETVVKEIELELKSNSYIYKVEGYDKEKEYKIYVDPVDGVITKTTEKISKRMYSDISKENTDKIGEILDRVLGEAPENSEIDKWSLELEDGELELDVRLNLENGESLEYRYKFARDELLRKK